MALNSLSGSTLRLTGLSSNMDTESIVKSMLQIDQLKVDKQFRTKTKLEWKGDAYRDFNLKLRSFRETYMSILNPSTNVFSSSAYNAYKVNMVTDTNAVSITAGSNASEGSLTIKSINELASAAKVYSTNMWDSGQSAVVSLDTKLKDAPFDTPLATRTVTKDDPDNPGQQISVVEKYLKFSINDEVFEFTEDDTINKIITEVNSRTNANVKMSYSSLTKGFTIEARQTGAQSEIVLANLDGSNAFGDGTSTNMGAFGIAEGTVHGVDAEMTMHVNGQDITVTRSSNSFAIDGISYTLKAKTTTAITFNVERDIEPVFQKIKGFIDGYNTLIEELQNAYNQKPNRSYSPLTDDERSQLTEKEAEKWEGLAKEGLLYRDSNISSLLNSMRMAFYDTVQGAGKSAADIGLTTVPYDYSAGGKIQIDEEKLRKALSENPEQVKDIFTRTSSATDKSTKYKEQGLVVRLSDAINSYVKNITDITLPSNTRELKSATSRLEQLETWLQKREDSYWKKFTAMETAMASMQSQSSWISSMLGTSS